MQLYANGLMVWYRAKCDVLYLEEMGKVDCTFPKEVNRMELHPSGKSLPPSIK